MLQLLGDPPVIVILMNLSCDSIINLSGHLRHIKHHLIGLWNLMRPLLCKHSVIRDVLLSPIIGPSRAPIALDTVPGHLIAKIEGVDVQVLF